MKNLPIVVVTGPDGSGKTTACAAVAAKFDAQYGKGTVACANIWDALAGTFQKDAVVRHMSALKGPARAWFIFHAIRHSVELAKAKSPKILLVDSYFYKYAASELAYGTSADVVRGAVAGFEKPALTICLDVDASAALARKSETSQYESGGGEFVKFQESIISHLKRLETEHGPWVHISSVNSPEAVATQILAEIERAGICKQMQSS